MEVNIEDLKTIILYFIWFFLKLSRTSHASHHNPRFDHKSYGGSLEKDVTGMFYSVNFSC